MKKCPKCNTTHSKLGKFCSRKCANSRIWNESDKKKKSLSAKNSLLVKLKNKRLCGEKIKLKCITCHHIFFVRPSEKKRHFCNKKCYLEYPNKKEFVKLPVGGYKKNSGRGKCGWYKGYFCQSSWELAWVIYQLEHNLKFKRNTTGFEYIFNGKTYKFYPDFKLNDVEKFVEVKGYMTKQTEAKFRNFPYSLEIIGKSDIKKYTNYVESKYGKNYISLYEK